MPHLQKQFTTPTLFFFIMSMINPCNKPLRKRWPFSRLLLHQEREHR